MSGGQPRGPTCFERVKYGAMIGFAIGISTGAIFGSAAGIRYGLRGRKLLSQLGKVMLQSGGSFAVFLAVGSAIRCWWKRTPRVFISLVYSIFFCHFVYLEHWFKFPATCVHDVYNNDDHFHSSYLMAWHFLQLFWALFLRACC